MTDFYAMHQSVAMSRAYGQTSQCNGATNHYRYHIKAFLISVVINLFIVMIIYLILYVHLI